MTGFVKMDDKDDASDVGEVIPMLEPPNPRGITELRHDLANGRDRQV